MAKKGWQVARIRDEEDYKTGGNSDFLSLDEGENFKGYFLGEADEKIDDPAFFPYKVHWINKGSVPCAGEECPYCEDGDRPRAKALTLWLVTRNPKGDKNDEGELMIWDMPVTVIRQLRELRGEDEQVKGREFRASRPEEKQYVLMPTTKTITKTQIKAALKDGPDFEEMLTNKLRKALEGVALAKVMDDDDDEPKSKKKSSPAKASKNGKARDDDDDDDEPTTAEWPDDGLDEVTVTVAKVDKDGNWIEVESDEYEGKIKVWTTDSIDFDLSDLSKGDEVVVTTGEKDDDDEYVLTDDPVVEEPNDDDNDGSDGGENNLPESIEDVEFEITEIDTDNQTIEVKSDEYEFTLFFLDKGPASKVDFDDYEVGNKVTFSAEKDSVGDMVATSIPEIVEEKKSKAAKSSKSKGGKSKSPSKGGKSKGGKGKK